MRDPNQLILPTFEGRQYPNVRVAFGGGIEGDAGGDELLEELSSHVIGDSFRVLVSGEVLAKRHQIKHTADGDERVLTIALKVDSVEIAAADPWAEAPAPRVLVDDVPDMPPFETAIEAMNSTTPNAP